MKIAVLCGGLSPERNVSISSGTKIAGALKENGHQVVLLDMFFGLEDYTGDITRIVLKTEEHIQQHDLMAVFLQRTGNFRAARDRDVALRAQTAAKNCNFHWDSPFVFS